MTVAINFVVCGVTRFAPPTIPTEPKEGFSEVEINRIEIPNDPNDPNDPKQTAQGGISPEQRQKIIDQLLARPNLFWGAPKSGIVLPPNHPAIVIGDERDIKNAARALGGEVKIRYIHLGYWWPDFGPEGPHVTFADQPDVALRSALHFFRQRTPAQSH